MISEIVISVIISSTDLLCASPPVNTGIFICIDNKLVSETDELQPMFHYLHMT